MTAGDLHGAPGKIAVACHRTAAFDREDPALTCSLQVQQAAHRHRRCRNTPVFEHNSVADDLRETLYDQSRTAAYTEMRRAVL